MMELHHRTRKNKASDGPAAAPAPATAGLLSVEAKGGVTAVPGGEPAIGIWNIGNSSSRNNSGSEEDEICGHATRSLSYYQFTVRYVRDFFGFDGTQQQQQTNQKAFGKGTFWLTRVVFLRGLAFVYLVRLRERERESFTQ